MFKKTLLTFILLLLLLNFNCTSLPNNFTVTYTSKNTLELLMEGNHRGKETYPNVIQGILVSKQAKPVLNELKQSERV